MKLISYTTKIIKEITGIQKSLPIYQSDGLIIHVEKRHPDCVDYMGCISDIIANPDYIGINPNEKTISCEMIKQYSDNIQIGIKLDVSGDYFYIATLYKITSSKIESRTKNGRLKKIDK